MPWPGQKFRSPVGFLAYLPDLLGAVQKDVKASFVVVRLRWAENESLKEEWACADELYSIARQTNMQRHLV
jgi:hypothetical protein